MESWTLASFLLFLQVNPSGASNPCGPFILQSPCCETGFTYVDLSTDPPIDVLNTASGITVLEGPDAQPYVRENCSKMALLKINFEKVTKLPCDYCVECSMCGRRMLRIDLSLSDGTRSGWGFNVGDSSTNNGYGGDAATQQNDAEAQGKFPNIDVFASDKCGSVNLKASTNAIDWTVDDVTIYVSNNHIRFDNYQGLDASLCHDCLFALNGQSDSEGPINEDVYLSLNRVIQDTPSRRGIGVCSATLYWTCDTCQEDD